MMKQWIKRCGLAAVAMVMIFSFTVAWGAEQGRTDPNDGQVKLQFQFTGKDATQGWSATKDVTLEPSTDGLSMQASGWDGKIYRAVELPAGRYNVYGYGMGATHVLLKKGWKQPTLMDLNLSSDMGHWRTWWDDVHLSGGKYLLVVKLNGNDVKGKIQWLRVENAPPQPAGAQEATPSPEQLGAHRPDPPMVRGFNVSMGLDPQSNYAAARQWGANVLRLQVRPIRWAKRHGNQSLWEGFEAFLDALDQRVAAAQTNGMKVVVDLHELPIEGLSPGDLDAMHKLWTVDHEKLETNLIRVWQGIVKKLLPRREAIWGYDLLNEPLDRRQLPWTPRQWRSIAVDLVKAIRKADPKTWLIYESGPGGMYRGIDKLTPLPDDRIIYSIHWYAPGGFCFQGVNNVADLNVTQAIQRIHVHYPGKIHGQYWDKAALAQRLAPVDAFQKKWHVPIYVGEFSVIRWAPRPDSAKWLRDTISLFEEHGWSWTYHAWREWPGWSLEAAPVYWKKGMPMSVLKQKAEHETQRAAVVKEFLQRNAKPDLSESGGGASKSPDQHRLPQPSIRATSTESASPRDDGVYRILFLGDSITRHGKAPKLGWNHVSGMAASSLNKDYAHQLLKHIEQAMSDTKVEGEFAGLRSVTTYRLADLEAYRQAGKVPDLVIVQTGEHDHPKEGIAAFLAGYDKFLAAILALPGPPRVICTGVWSPPWKNGGPYKDGEAYQGWPKELDAAMRQTCEKLGIPFVSVMTLATNPRDRGSGKVPGVRWHPNDRGHAGYAQRLFDAWQSLSNNHSTTPAPSPSHP